MSMHAQQAYLEGEVLQADPVQLIRILYRAGLDSIHKARQAVRLQDITQRSRHVSRASEILSELALAVDHKQGGEIARNLVELYDYIQHLLHEGNFQNSEPPLEEAARLISVLLDAWEHCESSGMPSAHALPAIPPMEESFTYSRSLTY